MRRLRAKDNGLLLFAVSILLPPSLLLSFAAYKYDWYLAPVFWTTAFIAAKGVEYLRRRWKGVLLLIIPVILFGYGRQLYQINDSARQAVFIPPSLAQVTDTIATIGALHQDALLQLEWLNKPIIRPEHELEPHAGLLVVADTMSPNARMLASAPLHLSIGNCSLGKW